MAEPVVFLARHEGAPVLVDCENKPSCGRWSRHLYVGIRRVTVGGEACDEEVWSCQSCGTERRFGLRAVHKTRLHKPSQDDETSSDIS